MQNSLTITTAGNNKKVYVTIKHFSKLNQHTNPKLMLNAGILHSIWTNAEYKIYLHHEVLV